MKSKKIIKVFPNSGHQYECLNLNDLLPEWNNEKIDYFVEANPKCWNEWDAFTPWVMYRYEARSWDNGGPLLRLAIETNLGSPTNGILIDVEQVEKSEENDLEETENLYASFDEANIEEDYGIDRCIPLTFLPNSEDIEIEVSITIHWIRATGSDPVEVDLVVDLGNTRTVALLLEQPGKENIPFGHRVQPVRFMPPCDHFSVQNFNGAGIAFDDLSIIDSWFVLKRSNFSDFEPPYGERKILKVLRDYENEDNGSTGSRRKLLKFLANSFIEISPAVIGGGNSRGGARQALAQASLDEDARFTMGSPKRYSWDDRPVGASGSSYWSQIPKDSDPLEGRPFYFEKLNGSFRLFMDPEGKDWDINGLPKEEDLINAPFRESPPNFPRRDSICWFALSILEAAYRQINSKNYLNVAKRRTLPRRLSKVSVLYPTGWTKVEKDAYFEQWKRALRIFSLTHLKGCKDSMNSGMNQAPEVLFEERGLDESMCAQLPVVYSEVTSLGGSGKEWLKLYGDGKKVRVMNIDIGGGTTDLSVIEYRLDSQLNKPEVSSLTNNDPTARMLAKLLFKDGKSVAGDSLVKRIIEELLIPLWLKSCHNFSTEIRDEEKQWLLQLFAEPDSIVFAGTDPRLPSKISRAVRLVFLPIVNHLLAGLGKNEKSTESIDIGVENIINHQVLAGLNQSIVEILSKKIHGYSIAHREYFPLNSVLRFEREKIDKLVDEVFAELLEDLLHVFKDFPCDLVILSGKPSELSRIREKVQDGLPLLPNRIINLRGYQAGDWYPFAEKGEVADAKTAAVVGAALHQDILNGNLAGFSLQEEPYLQQTPHYWGCINSAVGDDEFFNTLILDKRQLDLNKPCFVQAELNLGAILGRKSSRISPSNPEPVYELCYDAEYENLSELPKFRCKIKWSLNQSKGEHLELSDVSLIDDRIDIDLSKVTLKLRTLVEESHWMDSPSLTIGGMLT